MIHVISIQEKDKWNKVVKSFENYDVCYLHEYASAFWHRGDGEPMLLYYEDQNTRAMNVVMKRNIAQALYFQSKLEPEGWYDLSTPYGYGGFWFEGVNRSRVEEEYLTFCREAGYISEFVRFHLYSNYQDVFQGELEHRTHNIVRDLTPSMEEILHDFEYKVRKNLKRAESVGLKVEIDTSGRRLLEFLEIYQGTMQRNNAKDSFRYPREFFDRLNLMQGNYVYLHALHDDKVISTELVLYGSENCYSFLGGTDSRYFAFRPNDFLKYEIIKWAREKKLKRFILGGGYGADDGIYQFKKSFAPQGSVDFYIGKRIFDQSKYNKLLEIRKEGGSELDTQFFPLYRG